MTLEPLRTWSVFIFIWSFLIYAFMASILHSNGTLASYFYYFYSLPLHSFIPLIFLSWVWPNFYSISFLVKPSQSVAYLHYVIIILLSFILNYDFLWFNHIWLFSSSPLSSFWFWCWEGRSILLAILQSIFLTIPFSLIDLSIYLS